jgi:hypothetical protein
MKKQEWEGWVRKKGWVSQGTVGDGGNRVRSSRPSQGRLPVVAVAGREESHTDDRVARERSQRVRIDSSGGMTTKMVSAVSRVWAASMDHVCAILVT